MPAERRCPEEWLLGELLGGACLAEDPGGAEPSEWEPRVALARANRAAPRLAHRLLGAGAGRELPEALRALLSRELAEGRARIESGRAALSELGQALAEGNVKAMLFKGRALLRPPSMAPGRSPRDLDVLVEGRSLERADRILTSIGCVRTDALSLRTLRRLHLGPTYESPTNGWPVDLQWSFQGPYGDLPPGIGEVFARSSIDRALGVGLPTRVDACLVALDDLARRLARVADRSTPRALVSGLALQGGLMRLVEFHDEVQQLTDAEREPLVDRARRSGLEPALRVAFAVLSRYVEAATLAWIDCRWNESAAVARSSDGGAFARLARRLRRGGRRALLTALRRERRK